MPPVNSNRPLKPEDPAGDRDYSGGRDKPPGNTGTPGRGNAFLSQSMGGRSGFRLLSLWGFFSALIILWHLFANTGFFGYDDLQYAEVAARMVQGEPDWNDHFSFRWTVTGATALSYRLLGIGDTASALPAMFLSLATLGLITITLRRHSPMTVAAALALFTLNFWSLFYSDKLMPDVYVAFFVTAAILIYSRVSRNGTSTTSPASQAQVTSGILFALALTGAFLSKETVVLVLPLLAWWLIRDLIRNFRHGGLRRFWIAAVATGLLLLGGILLGTALLTGDPAARMTALLGNRYVSFCDYASQPLRELLIRLSYGLAADFTRQGMMAGVILTLPALLLLRSLHRKSPGTKPLSAGHPNQTANEKLRFFVTTSVILLLSANFMSITPWAYNPMCTDPRHFLFLIPTLAIAGALAMETWHHHRVYWLYTLAITLLFSLLITAERSQTLFEQLLPLAGLSLLGALLPRKARLKWFPTALLLLILLLAVKPLHYLPYAQKVGYGDQKAFIHRHLLNGAFDRIFTDEVQKRLIRFYKGFSQAPPEVFNWEEALKLPDNDTVRIALMTNRHTAYLSGGEPGKDPWMATRPELTAAKVVEEEALGLTLYARQGWINPRLKAAFHYDFEKEHPLWSGGRVGTPEEGAASGTRCDIPDEYSATFRIATDTLKLTPGCHLLVTCRFQFRTPEKTEAVVVISAPSTDEKELWEGIPLFPQVRAFGTWSPMVFHTLLETNLISPGSEISLYIWNLKKEMIHIDDWEILLSDLPPPATTDHD